MSLSHPQQMTTYQASPGVGVGMGRSQGRAEGREKGRGEIQMGRAGGACDTHTWSKECSNSN